MEIINDFAAKGFGSGQKGYSPSARTVHISDLKQCDFSKTEIYSFTSGDRQYQLHVLTGEIPGLLKHEAKIHCARLVLSGKIPKESRKGIRLLMKSDGFLDTLMITGTSKTAMFTHAIIHHKGKSSICNHIDGFDN